MSFDLFFEKFKDITQNDFIHDILSHCDNITIKQVVNNIDKNWDFKGLCKNPNITFEELLMIEDYTRFDRHINYSWLSQNPNITHDIVCQHMDKPWNKYFLCLNSGVICDEFLKTDFDEDDMLLLYKNHKIDVNTILGIRYPCNEQEWKCVGLNPNLRMEFVMYTINTIRWDWSTISLNQGITDEDVLKYPLHWHWDKLSFNSNITIRVILKFSDKPWNWSTLSRNKNLTLKDVVTLIDKPWNWSMLSACMKINIQDILNNDVPWVWSSLSINAHITLTDILKHNDKPWDWVSVSLNPNLTYKDYMDNQDKNWVKSSLLLNVYRRHTSKIPAKNLIVKTYRTHRLNKLFKTFQTHSKRVYYNREVIILPGIGVDYFKAMDRFYEH